MLSNSILHARLGNSLLHAALSISMRYAVLGSDGLQVSIHAAGQSCNARHLLSCRVMHCMVHCIADAISKHPADDCADETKFDTTKIFDTMFIQSHALYGSWFYKCIQQSTQLGTVLV